MTLDEAKTRVNRINNDGHWINFLGRMSDDNVILDGDYSIEDLEAIVTIMRAKLSAEEIHSIYTDLEE